MSLKNVTKPVTMTGINGTFTALIEVKFNYRSETKEVHNRSTHDEEKRKFVYHIVTGIINGEVISSAEFQNEHSVWQHIDDVEKRVNAKLHFLANVSKEKSLMEQLREKGYA